MSWTHFFSRLKSGFIYFGMPAVTAYHLVCSNVFLNTAADDAHPLEKIGDYALAPFRYLFVGNRAHFVEQEQRYDVRQHFDYHEHLWPKTTGSLLALPLSVILGSTLKGVAFLNEDVRKRHRAILEAVKDSSVVSQRDFYRSISIDLGDNTPPLEKLISMDCARRPEDQRHLCKEKQAFFQIIEILKAKDILFWADCGTCLGAYRYGGMIPWDNDLDIAVLQPDLLNVRHALNLLNSAEYLVEDWSNRLLPNTYLRIYIRSTREYIDIYAYDIHADRKTISYISSNIDNIFMTKGWKTNEGYYTVETPFDIVFPLRLADFDGTEVPVPNQTKKYLQMRYGENLSPVKVYNAQTNTYEKDLSHPYWQRVYVH